MIKVKKHTKGQVFVEYSFLFSLVILALVIVSRYILAASNGRIKNNADNFGEQFSFSHSNYEQEISSNFAQSTSVDSTGEEEKVLTDKEIKYVYTQDDFSSVGLKDEEVFSSGSGDLFNP